MLGSTPLVSMSDRRLSWRQYSGFPYLAASRVVAVSTSRIVKPKLSRTVRNLAPAVILLLRLVDAKIPQRRGGWKPLPERQIVKTRIRNRTARRDGGSSQRRSEALFRIQNR